MSCYEWEEGSIKLSCKEYGRIKKEMIAAVKKYHEDLFNNALKLHERMIAAAKGKRGVNWIAVFSEKRHESSGHMTRWGFQGRETDLDSEGIFYRNYLKFLQIFR